MASARFKQHPDGITTIDAEYTQPGYASIHLIERAGRLALVDTGTNDSVPLVLDALARLGHSPDAVELLFITHVHLDHAGGAGSLMQALPRARAVAHPRSVPHLADPSRLVQASREVYGAERFAALYGNVLPIERSRIVETRDGDQLELGGSSFHVLHTPGHALHHHVLHDLAASAVFTGDTFGLSYRQLDSEQGPLILPTTTPTQFDPEQLVASIRRIVALGPEALYLTHYGRVTGAEALGASLERQIRHFVGVAQRCAGMPQRKLVIQEQLRAYWAELVAAHGTPLEPALQLLAGDLELNAQGLDAWLSRGQRPR